MTREHFAAYVASLEPAANRNPAAHARRTAALALLGFAYLIGVLIVCLAVTVALGILVVRFPNALTIKLGLGGVLLFAGMGWSIVKSMWVRLPPPEGRPLTRAEFPKLFEAIDDVRGKLSAPAFHCVVLDSQYNAAVHQIPRLGLLGWYRNYLVLGLPLMQGLAPEEFKGVLAHEFGHLSGQHGRFGHWLYRLRLTWMQAIAHLQQQSTGWLAKPLTAFLDWFWPKFNGHAFVLSRANEYEADDAAARIVTPTVMGHALTRVALQARSYQEDFWEGLGRRALVEPEPPAAPYREAAELMRNLLAAPTAAKRLEIAFRCDTHYGDTHPCLRERLQALKVLPKGVPVDTSPIGLSTPNTTAAVEYLGEQESILMRELEQRWLTLNAAAWKERFAAGEKLRSELAAQESASITAPGNGSPEAGIPIDTATSTPPTPDALWRRAELILQLHGDAAAVPLLEQLVQAQPLHVSAAFVLARHLLSRDEPRGEVLLEQVLAQDPALTHEAAELLHAYYTRTGQREKLAGLLRRVDQADAHVESAQRERVQVSPGDTFEPAGLTEEQRTKLIAVLIAEPKVIKLQAVRKQVAHFRDQPVDVLVLHRRRHWWKPESREAPTQLAQSVLDKIELPGVIHIIPADKNGKWVRALSRVDGSLIYERAK